MSEPQHTIEIDDLVKHYGHVEALRGMSLHVERGEIFGLLGANGAGKTTLIKVLVGITHPTSGSARVLGMDPVREVWKLRRRIGYMPQTAVLYDDLSARDNVRFFGKAHDLPDLKRRTEEVLDFVGLLDRQHDPVHTFSGGMKQRTSLACALVHEPDLLLLDEPSTGVDPKLRQVFWEHFRELTNRGKTILISTHQMDEVVHCDRALVMRAGEALACDTPRGLLARGRTTVRLYANGDFREAVIARDAAEQLPQVLGVKERYDRIEIVEDHLEDVILALIDDRVQG